MRRGKNYSPVYILILFTFCVLLCSQSNCRAQAQEEGDAGVEIQWQEGPSIADMDEWAEIQVPAGFVFANGSDTKVLMEAMGNPASNQEVGFLAPESFDWFIVFEFDEIGYIKDDEKDDLDADAILDSIREGTEEGNKLRREKGFTGLSIVGWEVTPHYNENTHNLEWAIRAEDDNGELVLNHNTRLLGRRGVMRVTLVAEPQIFSNILDNYREKLEGFSFKSGQKYAEFTEGDKIAQYGLTALVAGGAGAAAAKLGLFKIIAKFGKIILVAVLAFFAAISGKIKNLFGK